MNKKIHSIIIITILLCITTTQACNQNSIEDILTTDSTVQQITLQDKTTIQNIVQYQDGRNITKLQWTAPEGELPGTYTQYLKTHPRTSAIFYKPTDLVYSPLTNNIKISMLVNENLYPKIKTNLQQYITDIELEGYSVYVETILGGTPEDIKIWIKNQNNTGAIGIIFIGDITAAWAEVSESIFPCDLFYMDLDGEWIDNDNNGIYEDHQPGNGDMGPELYVGRIYATSLDYDSEENMVNHYLAKTHAFRTGNLTQPWRGLEYVDEDWYTMEVHLNKIYGLDVVRYDYGYFTTGQDYLNQMDLGQHFVQVCAHSYSGGHHFGQRPTESASYTHIYVYSPQNQQAKLLLGSDDGIKVWLNGVNVYTNDRYGSWNPDDFEVDVQLLQGWNQLLCKISQEGGDYKISAQFTDQNYNPIPTLNYQINNPDLHGAEAPYIRGWLLHGFHQDTSENFWEYLTTNYLNVDEATINPNDGDIMAGKKWKQYNSSSPYTNMGEYCSYADYGVCYAFTRVYASDNITCQLWTGYDDGARIWLNGNEVLYDNRYGGFEADMTKTDVVLQKGENRVLIKISEWMGDHGFSARFCHADGTEVTGLLYDPQQPPITYVGTWLINGPYVNPNKATRLSEDYLNGEASIIPSEGDPAPYGTWQRGIGNGCPFNLDNYFDHGDWVYSEDIQIRDPPVLFYNLFACGPGRFTDENFLAGAYIFNTQYGLITVASSKSGSMLNFYYFTKPLSEGKTIGGAFQEWFDSQAPYQLWEKEWYYGMVVFGDPTLTLIPQTQLMVTKPINAIYFRDKLILPFIIPIVFGDITVEAEASNAICNISQVEFIVDGTVAAIDYEPPYTWLWENPLFFRHKLSVIAYDSIGRNVSTNMNVWKFF